MELAFDVHMPVSVERVFPYLAEPEKWLEYEPGVLERSRIGEGPIGPGTQWRAVDRVGPVTVRFIDELVSLEENEHVRFRQSSPWNSWGEFSVEPEDGGSLVRVYFEGSPTGKIWWLNLIPNRMAARGFSSDLRDLGERLADGRL